jgi:hypothetical protein
MPGRIVVCHLNLARAAMAVLAVVSGLLLLPSDAAAAPGVPVYLQTITDCITGDHFVQNQTNNQPDPGCDDYALDLYERPFNVRVDRSFTAPFGLIGCSVNLQEPLPFDGVPPVHVTAAATAPGSPTAPGLFLMGLYVSGSGGPGWLIEGDGRYLYSSNATRNATGVWIVGDGNTVDIGQYDANDGSGLLITGDDNVVKGAKVHSNGGHGIEILGHGNTVDLSTSGGRLRGNARDGITVIGGGNRVANNTVHANGGDDIEVSGGTPSQPNVITKNLVGEYAAGNLGDGIAVRGGLGNGLGTPIEIEKNTVRANGGAGIVIDTLAAGHDLRNNVSGGMSRDDNQGCEYVVAPGNFNSGGNQANRTKIPVTAGKPFLTGCIGTP